MTKKTLLDFVFTSIPYEGDQPCNPVPHSLPPAPGGPHLHGGPHLCVHFTESLRRATAPFKGCPPKTIPHSGWNQPPPLVQQQLLSNGQPPVRVNKNKKIVHHCCFRGILPRKHFGEKISSQGIPTKFFRAILRKPTKFFQREICPLRNL